MYLHMAAARQVDSRCKQADMLRWHCKRPYYQSRMQTGW